MSRSRSYQGALMTTTSIAVLFAALLSEDCGVSGFYFRYFVHLDDDPGGTDVARRKTPANEKDPDLPHGSVSLVESAELLINNLFVWFSNFKRVDENGKPLKPTDPPRSYKVFKFIDTTDVKYGRGINILNISFISIACILMIYILAKAEPHSGSGAAAAAK
ncbi:uncharacterized protein BXIN_1294 [Babesia sp. Xinjiang]|uniref:uncharacterized protein n=1 Tax=Babesia sp. Xinjiang TaxID=462227 RepID=UPI000A2381F4|nr:uncharacterized protein BXIN_1294 [Babesia sp. Xinjiang]ORM39902.1 hypothetical protein BXIN_1294 [Babesia sp. Xinjiang]